MKNVLIIGAGSIGNHLAYACRNKNWKVAIYDIDINALERTKKDIYPGRYGKWDDEIDLLNSKEAYIGRSYDLLIIGTPPDTHIPIALEILDHVKAKVMLIEKPLSTPDLKGCPELINKAGETDTIVTVGYNHTLTDHTLKAEQLLRDSAVEKPIYMYAAFREHWEGIFKAHPWLNGPADSYLGFSTRGGGAGGEHSHALNIWQHFSHVLGMGRITEVSAMVDIIKDDHVEYDRLFQVNLRSEFGLTGHVVQDVITKPHKKHLTIQGEKGFLDWQVNRDANNDALMYNKESELISEELFSKTRPDDFKGEIEHIAKIIDGDIKDSPISLQRGSDTMLVLAAAHLSNKVMKKVIIDYDQGYTLDALRT